MVECEVILLNKFRRDLVVLSFTTCKIVTYEILSKY